MTAACNACAICVKLALRNFLQHFTLISGLKLKQKLCLETGSEAQYFWHSNDLIFQFRVVAKCQLPVKFAD